MVTILMSTNNIIFSLRKQWFKLQAKDFLSRYSKGLMVIAIFLPGVAIGDNFNILMSVITQPFILISENKTTFFNKLIWLIVLQAVFIVWARAQRQAINGGEFRHYLQTLPIDKQTKNRSNIGMLLIANHFLWPIIFAGFYYLIKTHNPDLSTAVLRYIYLVLLLLTTQYIAIFKLDKTAILILTGLNICLLFTLDFNFVLIILMWVALSFFIAYLLGQNEHKKSQYDNIKIRIIPTFLEHNFYYQILIKSTYTSTVFRLIIMGALILGYTLVAHHFVDISQNDLLPYSLTLEALLAYYISGFFVTFNDERLQMEQLLITLPVKKSFWFIKDVMAVFLLTTLIHLPFYLWQLNYFNISNIIFLTIYHLILILICYPIRVILHNNQTLISFVVLFIASAITIFNLP